MKLNSLHGLALAAIAGMTLTVRAQDNIALYPTITQQPLDQCVALGGTATFSVTATNATGYQWLFNNAAVDGQTNDSIEISGVTLTNVGLYSVFVFNGSDAVPSRSAALDAYIGSGGAAPGSGGSTISGSTMAGSTFAPMDGQGGGQCIVVFGAPVFGGGSSGSCPGRYSGYVNFLPPSGWGFLPATNTTVYTAIDTNQTITKVQYTGCYGDSGCEQTTVIVPYPAMSPQYRFTIYFPTNCPVPTNAYPITLSGFNP